MLRLCRSTSRRKASWSPPLAFATAAASSVIWFIRRPGVPLVRAAARNGAMGYSAGMFGRQTSGSVVCASCGYLVGVNDDRCYHCGRWNPGLWGYAPVLRRLGNDMGFVPFVTGTCIVAYAATLLFSAGRIGMSGFDF